MELWSANRGYMSSDNLSEELRTALQPMCRFRQLCDVEIALGKNVGDSYSWNIYGDTEDEGGQLDETLPMPETGFPVSQGTVTITEYGISVPYTGKFDALSEHPVKKIIHDTLKRNANRAFDTAAHEQFDATIHRAVGGAAGAITFSENGTPNGTNNIELGFDHVKTMSDEMQERNIPLFDTENYAAVMRPSTMRPILDDLEEIIKYVPEGYGRIMNGEKGRADCVRFISQTNIASEGWSNSKSDAAYFFGADTVTEVVTCPEEIRGKIPDDYGRGKGIAWYYLGAFAITHNDSTNALTRAQGRIIKWDSAA